MFVGTFEELRKAGQNKGRWLMVNVQDSKQFASQVLNRDVWSHGGVRTILSRHFLFWQIHSITDDGLRFKQLYHVETFPYISIIDPRTGEKMLDWSTITANKFITELTEFLHNNAFSNDQDSSRDMKTVAELSEKEQLEAAIKASLHESRPETRDFPQENGDSDEFISFDSGDEEEMDQCEPSKMERDVVKDGAASSIDVTAHPDPEFNSTFAKAQLRDTARDQNYFSASPFKDELLNIRYRKRKSSFAECVSMPLKKMPRSSTMQEQQEVKHSGNVVTVKVSELAHSLSCKGKGKSSVSKGKTPLSVEEQLESGKLLKAEVSRILIRLPNGSRLHKAFLSNSPIKELFSFLSERDIDSTQHEIMTNFPKRSLKDLNHFLTFKEAGLYPSVTVFVQD
ncbi:UBX domain-containing protein 7 [Geodia barretti]|nr:UBX domain-containing protein 7 [Geodia barretti]